LATSTVKGAILAEKIDWIAYTQTITSEWDFPSYIDDHWKTIKPMRHYDNGEENKQGVKRFWNKETPSQGRFVVLAGQASGILQEDQFDFLQWVSTTDRKATRIDFALDIIRSKFTPQLVRKHLLSGEAVTHAVSMLRIGEIGGNGDTQYVGKKSSETYTRIYDKRVEQKADFNWCRVETVYQGDRAKPALEAYCECKSTRPLIKAHINFPAWSDWGKIMSDNVVKLRTSSYETATRAWLLGQVAKSMAKELARDEEHGFWFDFQERVREELARIEGKHDIIDF